MQSRGIARRISIDAILVNDPMAKKTGANNNDGSMLSLPARSYPAQTLRCAHDIGFPDSQQPIKSSDTVHYSFCRFYNQP